MVASKIFWLIGTILVLNYPFEIKSQHDGCQICLLLCSKDGTNLPMDFHSLKDGINQYPPRLNRPLTLTNGSISLVTGPEQSCPYTPEDVKNVLVSIDRIVNSFYAKNYQKITMRSDGGIGLGVLSGQLSYLLGRREDKFSPKLKSFLEDLHKVSSQVGLQILDQSIQASTDASNKYGAQVIRNNTRVLQARFRDWVDPKSISQHFLEFKKIGDELEVIYPYLDFHCLVALVQDCSVPHVCQKMYLTDIYSQYMLMHQVIFQQFAERRSCITVNQEAFGNSQEYRDRLCAKAYLEAEFLERHDFPTRYIDLFAEQVGFCGLMGYPNFMRVDWLREILSWQSTSVSGCIADLYGEKKTTDAIVFADLQGKDDKSIGQGEPCLVHLTSVSLMALSVNLRYMMDVCPPNIFDWHF